jgi:hypothetical protein
VTPTTVAILHSRRFMCLDFAIVLWHWRDAPQGSVMKAPERLPYMISSREINSINVNMRQPQYHVAA